MSGVTNKLLKTNVDTNEELLTEIKNMDIQLNEKVIENENYQQEIHELRQKLKTCLATQKHLSDMNEMMEENLNSEKDMSEKKINNLLEKHAIDKKNWEERLSELQVILSYKEKENKELKEMLAAKEKLFVTTKSNEQNKSQETLVLKNKIDSLTNDLEERCGVERDLLSKQQELEETIANLQKNYSEVKDILQTKTDQLRSLNEILETTKNELVFCRSEIQSLKTVPASDCIKGNSLFAEVEDNRQKLINDMTSLKKKYIWMKQTYNEKENEIRALKAEKAMLLQKWEDDNVETVNNNAYLIETYKARISELENNLKELKKELKIKGENKNPADNNFSYVQSLLSEKKKEVEKLSNKLEENSIEKILQEEMKCEISKQLRQWRYKAMTYQAQLLVAQNQMKCEECLKIKLKNYGDTDLPMDTEHLDLESRENTMLSFPATAQLKTTLDKLLQVPKVPLEENKTLEDDLSKGDNSKRSEECIEPVQYQEKVCQKPTISTSMKSNDGYNKSDKENNKEISNINITTLKSALVKSEKKDLCLKSEDKSKKSLRFTADTEDNQKPKLIKRKIEKKEYPVVFISNQSKK